VIRSNSLCGNGPLVANCPSSVLAELVTLMRFDPFRELDRVAEQNLSAGTRAIRAMPIEALRRGDQSSTQSVARGPMTLR